MLIALWLLGCGTPEPDCEDLGIPADRDRCYQDLAQSKIEAAPEEALNQARKIKEESLRELMIVHVITESGAFDGHAVETVCTAEIQSSALRDQCQHFVDRAHLRVTDPAGRSAQEREPQINTLSSELRMTQPSSFEEILALEPLLEQSDDRWQGEARSLLAAELPMKLLQHCLSQGETETCKTLHIETLLPFGVRLCAENRALAVQCFDHLCANGVDLSVRLYGGESAEVLAREVMAGHAAALAVDPRIEHLPQCHATWLGRKLGGRGDLRWMGSRCDALGAPWSETCRGTLSEVGEHALSPR